MLYYLHMNQDAYQKSIEEFSKRLESHFGEGYIVSGGTVSTQWPITTKETIKEFIKAGKEKIFNFDKNSATT